MTSFSAVVAFLLLGANVQTIPSTIPGPGGRVVWVAADDAIDANGRFRTETLGQSIPSLRKNAELNRKMAAKAAAAPDDECRVFVGSIPDNFKPKGSLEELTSNAEAIVTGRVVEIRQGFLGGSPGSLLKLSATWLKGTPSAETYLFFPLAKIKTAEGLVCAQPVGEFDVPHVGDRFVAFAMYSPVVADGQAIFHVNLARQVVHEPRDGKPRLPAALKQFGAVPAPVDAIEREIVRARDARNR